MAINWKQVGKKADGSIAKKCTLMFNGVGRLMGGQFSASVDGGVAEKSAGGPAIAVLQWRRDGNTKPVVWREECACLNAAEIVIEEQGIAAMAAMLIEESRKELHHTDKREITLKGWAQIS